MPDSDAVYPGAEIDATQNYFYSATTDSTGENGYE